MRKYSIWLGFCLLLVIIIGQSVVVALGKDVKFNRDEVFETIRRGYEAQYSIRDKHYSIEKMYDVLSPYITDNFLQVFTDENHSRTKASGAYLLSKTPPFTFTSSTMMAYDKEHDLLYVYERSKDVKTPGYEIVVMQNDNGKWKMASYSTNDTLPEDIVRLEKG